MKEKFIQYKDAIIGNSIWDLLKLLLGLLLGAGIPGYMADIFTSYYSRLTGYKLPIIIAVCLICTIIFLELYVRIKGNTPIFPSVNSDYRILRRETKFFYDRQICHYELKIKLRAKRDGLDRFRGKYLWSGSDKAILAAKDRNHQLIELIRKDTFIDYELLFGQSYKKGKVVEFCVSGEMKDSKCSFIPFFNITIREQTDLLITKIRIPPKYGVREIILEEIAGHNNSNTVSRTQLLDKNGEYSWEIKNPKLFYVYTIRWQFP